MNQVTYLWSMIQWLSRILMLTSLSLLVMQATAKTSDCSPEVKLFYSVEAKRNQLVLDQDSPVNHSVKWIASEETENEDGDPDEQQTHLLSFLFSGNTLRHTYLNKRTPASYNGEYVLNNELRPIFLVFQNFRL